jgi:DNA primase
MGRISDDDVRRVRDANDLVGLVGERVVLRQKGRLWWGCCPFHGEKTPSFKIDPATQLWHCFGCGLGGDAYGFVMRSENVDFLDAVRLLAERANIEIQEEGDSAPKGHRERVIAACEAAADFYHEQLTRTHEAGATRARDYLGKRGFGSDVAKRWRLGYAPGRGALVKHLAEKGFSEDEIVSANLGLRDGGHIKDRFYERIMFPIGDLRGRCIAFGGRVVGTGEPKYLNTAETPVFSKSRNMFAIDRAKAQIVVTGTAVVVEGYTDVIALHEAGITNAVATLGTALTLEHVKLLGRFAKRVVYLFDGDAAGMRAADRAVEFVDRSVTLEAGAGRVQLHVAVIPGGLDPADFVAANGADALREVIDGAGELLRFAIDRRLARWDLERPEERFRALADAAEVLAPLKGSITADDYSAYIADQLSLHGVMAGLDAVRAAVANARPRTAVPSVEPEAVAEEQSEVPPASTPELRAERELLGILIRVSGLRDRARFLLSNDLLSERTHKVMAEVVAEASAEDDAATITAAIEERLHGASSALSASIVEDGGDADAEETVRALVRKLKEFQLERRIAAGKARLKQRDSFKNDAEYDDLYKVVSTLQVELSQLKLGVIDVEDTV